MIKGLIESLFLHLSAILTLVIPNLYKVFEYLATVQILTDDKVREIWNNLYILLSVLILFAIAIKLVNAIVNPDVLTDQKKGVRKAFFNAAIAVFLVALLPIFFGMFHEVQQHIVEDKIIQRFVFNDESEENGGTKMTWVAISSCMDLGKMDDIGIISLVDLGINVWNIATYDGHVVSTVASSAGLYIPDPSISTDESAYVFLLVLGNIRPWVTLANALAGLALPGSQLITGSLTNAIEDYFDFHPVILFIFLAVIAYELIIMVLDTALRAFKLALLELMTPIVLGAYVFKSDILKNWALEYIKTFLQVFLLLIALCFVEEVIPVIARISSVNESGYSLLNAFIRLLLYAGALRLVKQIGPLINKIFGTNIQAKGGIKGRLGEMAVVGGLAQKAWSALGNGAKNVGKLALAAPFVGGFMAADSMYKKKHDGKSITDTEAFRKGKGILSGVHTAVKTGNPLKVKDAYEKGSAPPSHSITDRLKAENARNASLRQEIFNATGIDMMDEQGNIKNTYIDADGKERFIPAEKLEQARNIIKSKYNTYDKSGSKSKKSTYQDYKDALSGIKSKQDDFINTMNTYAGDLRAIGKESEATIAENIADDIKNGKKLTGEQIKFLKDHSSDAKARNALALNGKITNEYSDLKKKYNGSTAVGGITALGSLGDIALSTEIGAYEGKINKLNNDYEIQKPDLDALSQDAVAKLDSQLESINKIINGSLQNNSSFSNYMERTGNNITLSADVPVDYLVSMSTGIVKPGYKDYGFSASQYEAFDNFVKNEASRGVNVGSQQFAADLKLEIANPTSALAGGTDDISIDFITDMCSSPATVLDKVHSTVSTEDFNSYISRVTPYVAENPVEGAAFVTKLDSMGGYSTESNAILDQVIESTVSMDDPVSIIDAVRSKMTDDNTFSKYVGIVENRLSPQDKTKLAIEMGKLDGGAKWYKDPSTGQWKK